MAVAPQTTTVSNSPPHSTKLSSWQSITPRPAPTNLSPKLNVATSDPAEVLPRELPPPIWPVKGTEGFPGYPHQWWGWCRQQCCTDNSATSTHAHTQQMAAPIIEDLTAVCALQLQHSKALPPQLHPCRKAHAARVHDAFLDSTTPQCLHIMCNITGRPRSSKLTLAHQQQQVGYRTSSIQPAYLLILPQHNICPISPRDLCTLHATHTSTQQYSTLTACADGYRLQRAPADMGRRYEEARARARSGTCLGTS